MVIADPYLPSKEILHSLTTNVLVSENTDKNCMNLVGENEHYPPSCIWASSQENLSLGFLTKRVSNQSLQLQRLARKLTFGWQQV